MLVAARIILVLLVRIAKFLRHCQSSGFHRPLVPVGVIAIKLDKAHSLTLTILAWIVSRRIYLVLKTGALVHE